MFRAIGSFLQDHLLTQQTERTAATNKPNLSNVNNNKPYAVHRGDTIELYNVEVFDPFYHANFDYSSQGVPLQLNRDGNLNIEKNQIYSVPTDYGLIHYRFIDDGESRYVECLQFDSQMSDAKRVHLERTRQFLQDLQTFTATGNPAYLDTARDNHEIIEWLGKLGITMEEPFTINDSKRYRLGPGAVIHDVDLESQTMKNRDWRVYGHTSDTVFLIQGVEYKMDENGKLPLPEDYVHKHEQMKIFNSNKRT